MRFLAWLVMLVGASPAADVKIFKNAEVVVRVVATGDHRSDVILEKISDPSTTDAIVYLFYTATIPGIEGKLVLSKTVTCPAYRGIATGCDRPADVPLKAVDSVKVKLLREVAHVDIKQAEKK